MAGHAVTKDERDLIVAALQAFAKSDKRLVETFAKFAPNENNMATTQRLRQRAIDAQRLVDLIEGADIDVWPWLRPG